MTSPAGKKEQHPIQFPFHPKSSKKRNQKSGRYIIKKIKDITLSDFILPSVLEEAAKETKDVKKIENYKIIAQNHIKIFNHAIDNKSNIYLPRHNTSLDIQRFLKEFKSLTEALNQRLEQIGNGNLVDDPIISIYPVRVHKIEENNKLSNATRSIINFVRGIFAFLTDFIKFIQSNENLQTHDELTNVINQPTDDNAKEFFNDSLKSPKKLTNINQPSTDSNDKEKIKLPSNLSLSELNSELNNIIKETTEDKIDDCFRMINSLLEEYKISNEDSQSIYHLLNNPALIFMEGFRKIDIKITNDQINAKPFDLTSRLGNLTDKQVALIFYYTSICIDQNISKNIEFNDKNEKLENIIDEMGFDLAQEVELIKIVNEFNQILRS